MLEESSKLPIVTRREKIMGLVGRFIVWCVGLLIAVTLLVTIPLTGVWAETLPKWITLTYLAGVFLLSVALMVSDLVLFAWKGESIWLTVKRFRSVSRAIEIAQVLLGLAIILVLIGLWVWAVVAIWPSGFLDTPFAYMTFGMLLRVAGSVVVAIVGILIIAGLYYGK